MSKNRSPDLLGLLLALSTPTRPTRHSRPPVPLRILGGARTRTGLAPRRRGYSPSPFLTVNIPMLSSFESPRGFDLLFRETRLPIRRSQRSPRYIGSTAVEDSSSWKAKRPGSSRSPGLHRSKFIGQSRSRADSDRCSGWLRASRSLSDCRRGADSRAPTRRISPLWGAALSAVQTS
jgi:hypothetical protein